LAEDGVGVAAMSRGVARVYTRTADERETSTASLQLVSPSFFPVLGVTPVLGRALPDNEAAAAAQEAVAVVSDGYWHRRFGGSPDVVGRTLSINGIAFTVIGVGPRDFAGVWLESPVDIWVPLTMQSAVHYAQSFSADGADFTRPWLPQPQIWSLHAVVRVPRERAATVLGSNLVSKLVFGVNPHDVASLVAATVLLVGVGTACSVIPARGAARIDPIIALSQE